MEAISPTEEAWEFASRACQIVQVLCRANSTHSTQGIFSAHFLNPVEADLVFRLLSGDEVELCGRCGDCRHPVDRPDGCEDPLCP